MYTCERCLKIFNHKTHYTLHLKRKIPCKLNEKSKINPINPINPETNNLDTINPETNKININTIIDSLTDNLNKLNDNVIVDNNTCPKCFKKFFQKSNVTKHIQNKSCKLKNIKNESQLILEKLKELLMNQSNINITNNTINNNTTNNNVNINIFSAGKEDLSRLTQEEIIKICTSGTYYPLVAAEIIHCNKNYPEFQNFLISNLRSTTGLVLINDSWISKPQEEILSNILQVDKKHVSTLIKDLKVDDKLQIKLESTKDEIDNNESKEHLKPKIKSKLYNASKMINQNKKSSLLKNKS